jgi:hypothetical protein
MAISFFTASIDAPARSSLASMRVFTLAVIALSST